MVFFFLVRAFVMKWVSCDGWKEGEVRRESEGFGGWPVESTGAGGGSGW